MKNNDLFPPQVWILFFTVNSTQSEKSLQNMRRIVFQNMCVTLFQWKNVKEFPPASPMWPLTVGATRA